VSAASKELTRQIQVRIQIGVTTQAQTAQAAAAQNAAQLDSAVKEMRKALGSAAELKTVGYSVHADYRYPQGGGQPGQFGPTSGTVAWASVNGPQFWINPFFVNPGDYLENFALIAHETLHNLGLIDPTIQTRLGIAVTTVTQNISDKLQQDCFPGNSGPSPIP
jgi:hypothetical protein